MAFSWHCTRFTIYHSIWGKSSPPLPSAVRRSCLTIIIAISQKEYTSLHDTNKRQVNPNNNPLQHLPQLWHPLQKRTKYKKGIASLGSTPPNYFISSRSLLAYFILEAACKTPHHHRSGVERTAPRHPPHHHRLKVRGV